MPENLSIEDRGNFLVVTEGDEKLLTLGKKQSFARGNCKLDIHQNKGSVRLEEEKKQINRMELKTEELESGYRLHSDSLEVKLKIRNSRLEFKANADKSDFLEISIPAKTDEKFFGMGEQYTGPELTGESVPVVVQEQGIGRGKPVVSRFVEMVSKGSSGHSTSSYFPLPRYLSSRNYMLQLDCKDISRFDFSEERVRINIYGNEAEGKILFADEKKDLLQKLGEKEGKMNQPPSWVSSGAILGLQGGKEKVLEKLDSVRRGGAPISAIWIQDWEGQRTKYGEQLWWDWSLDTERYNDWDQFKTQLDKENIKLLGYINPYLVERDEECLFDVAKNKDLLLKDDEGEILFDDLTGFDAAMLDLSKDKTVEWIKKIIEENLVENGFDGWMADFGESMPFDSEPENADSREYHNRYAEKWIEINSEVAEKNDCFFFNRTGFTVGIDNMHMIWCGDQLTSWDEYDGMESALYGMLNGGVSGLTLLHSDTGGYHSYKRLGVGISRSKELMKRWTEMNAFTALLRTHEGNMPSVNVQASDEDVRDHFGKFGKIYQALGSYRKKMFVRAEKKNIPVVRPLFLEFDDEECFDIGNQFMFGPDFLVAPIMEKGSKAREVYLPEGEWVHLWSQEEFNSEGQYYGILAPIGKPPVFFRKGSDAGVKLLNKLENQNTSL